jgi:CRP-like cAMP-binding protein
MADFPTRNYSRDDQIFEEGAIATVAYILKRGCIEISVTRKGNKIVLATLKPGAIFGEMALILESHRRTATARALEDSEVIVIYKNSFYEYLTESSVVTRTLIKGLIDRLYKTTTMLVETDELSRGICQMLRLLNLHQVSLLDYDEVVKAFSKCFRTDPAVIQEKLEQLARSNLLEFETMPSGKKGIKVNHNIVYIDDEPGG